MKVLSLLQPWASLVVLGHKKIETRSWNTKHRGPLLIHASLGKQYKKLRAADPLYSHYFSLGAKGIIEPIAHLPFGAIIGMVNVLDTAKSEVVKDAIADFKDTITFHTETKLWQVLGNPEQELAFGDYSPGRYGWLLSDPVVFDEPIPAKGKLGLWEYDGHLP